MKRIIPLAIMFSCALPLVALGPSCSHYSWGGQKPKSMEKINTLNVAVFQNNTFYPRAEVLLTSSVADEISSNGTFRLASKGNCDATVRGAVNSVTLDQSRAESYNTYRSTQGTMTVSVSYEVVSGNDGTVLRKGTVQTSTNYFTSGNEQAAKWDAYSYAARQAAQRVVADLVN